MSSNRDIEEDDSRRRYGGPYTGRHPIPTVQQYREDRDERENRQEKTQDAQGGTGEESTTRRAFGAAKAVLKGQDPGQPTHDPYPSANRNTKDIQNQNEQENQKQNTDQDQKPASSENDTPSNKDDSGKKDGSGKKTATETAAGASDPRQKRKAMKHMKRDDGGREVTDPVTHLPVVIYDATPKDLKGAPENEAESGELPRTMTGMSGASKSQSQHEAERDELQRGHDGMNYLFPPPNFDDTRDELLRTFKLALTAGVGAVIGLGLLTILGMQVSNRYVKQRNSWWSLGTNTIATLLFSACSVGVAAFMRGWLGKKVEETWQDEVWDAARGEEQNVQNNDAIPPESVAWLNSLFASIWPLINPDLFTSIADMLEDVMQASLPKIVRMVSVDDLGQGNEAFRILGIRWLPTGAASQTVGEDGELKSAKESQHQNSDRTVANEGEQDADDDKSDSKADGEKSGDNDEDEQAIREGMEAEQGDFVNMEMAFAYRARSSGKSLKSRAKNAHLYLRFYLPGGIVVPVWVEMRGIIGKMRLRLQLTPDPPFFSLCTLTFLGQPKADLSCIPISKHALNLMDVPLISSFVQSSIDAALAEYVAPKSLTLDLKDMLVGDDFKKDTVSRGVVMILLKKARDFKEGDGGMLPGKDGSSDAYATVSWGKFGKPAAATRIIPGTQKPNWNEWCQILVSPEEINAEEKLRIQLWDSDKHTADDDLGRVEVDLKDLMYTSKTRNQMCDREDRFKGEDADEEMPGTLTWSVGYYEKVRITKDQLEKQTADDNIRSMDDLEKKAREDARRKLREAGSSHETEIEQQSKQDIQEMEDDLRITAPPPEEFASGIFSIQIHNITGLQVQILQKQEGNDGEGEDEDEETQADLPSSYATIILNHQKIFRTRTKPKNAKPFFNAGTERFIKDWRTTEVMVSVRDDREKENDSLLGMVYLPLSKLFEKRSQVMDSYPLAGGMGYGRIRLSMVWRSVELKLPKEMMGWNYGTLEVKTPIKGDVQGLKMKLRTNLAKATLSHEDGQWTSKKEVFLAIRKRHSAALVVQFKKSSLGPDSVPAFGVLWLNEIPDEEDTTVKLTIWKNEKDALKEAENSCDYEGEKQGEVEMTLKFWRGLSTYHKRYANKGRNSDVKNVMEVLDTADDEGANTDDDSEADETKDKLKTHTNQDSSGSEDDSDAGLIEKVKQKASDVAGHNDSEDGSRGPVSQMRDYKDHHKQLHRKHRGIMQFKGARSLDFLGDKAKRIAGKTGDLFKHEEKEPDIETEV